MQQLTSRRSRYSRGSARRFRLRGEFLEDRRLLAIFTVTSVGDAGPGSLRDAISQANMLPGPDIVNFNLASPSTIAIQSELVISEALEVTGELGDITVDAGGTSRVFRISAATPNPQAVTMRQLTLTNGRADRGGAIFNDEHLTLDAVSILGNAAANVQSVGDSLGGGIYNQGSLSLIGSRVIGNRAMFRPQGDNHAFGGAIASLGSQSSLIVQDSLIARNEAIGGSGGAIFHGGGRFELRRSTVDGNAAGLDTMQYGQFQRSDQGGGIAAVSLLPDGTKVPLDVSIVESIISGNTVRNDSITAISRPTGGGVSLRGYGAAEILDSLLQGNRAVGIGTPVGELLPAQGLGGAVSAEAEDATENVVLSVVIDPTEISSNYASTRGGGVFLRGTIDDEVRATLDRCTLSGNTGVESGGAVYSGLGSRLDVLRSSFLDNVTQGNGGGLVAQQSRLFIRQSTLAGNSAGGSGGGLSVFQSDILFENSTVSGNTAFGDGGGVWSLNLPASQRSTKIQFTTIASNLARGRGGGVANEGVGLQIDDSIVSGNAAQSGPDLASLPPSVSQVRYTLVATPGGHTLENGVDGNIVGFSANLGPLQDNGGDTLTQLPPRSSPVIGRANPDATLATDQRARLRPGRDGLRDLGAVESDATKPGDFNRDGEFDCVDIDQLTAEVAMGGTDLTFDLNADGLVNLADVATWLQLAGEHNLGPGRVYLPGDANLDAWVDGSDFGIWNARRFTLDAGWCGGDFNADGAVDGSDFGIWNAHKFMTSQDSASRWSEDFRTRRELPAEVWEAALVAVRSEAGSGSLVGT